MPSQLFAVVPDDRFLVVQLQVPNMDSDACEELDALLDDQVSKKCQPVILDLTRAKFLPSLAIGSLVNVKKKLDQCNSRLVIVGLSANIRRALEATNLDKVFALVDSLQDAIAPAACRV